MAKKKPIKLNLGCGANKIEGFVNIDNEPSVKPDVLCDFVKGQIPFKDSTIDEVIIFHTIEHINKRNHSHVLSEIWRVLKPGGALFVSYPEFSKCVKNWLTNKQGMKEFWEATIFGRQLFPSDYHVCVMDTSSFTDVLKEHGFGDVSSKPEPGQVFNTIVSCKKIPKPLTYVDMVRNDMTTAVIQK